MPCQLPSYDAPSIFADQLPFENPFPAKEPESIRIISRLEKLILPFKSPVIDVFNVELWLITVSNRILLVDDVSFIISSVRGIKSMDSFKSCFQKESASLTKIVEMV